MLRSEFADTLEDLKDTTVKACHIVPACLSSRVDIKQYEALAVVALLEHAEELLLKLKEECYNLTKES